MRAMLYWVLIALFIVFNIAMIFYGGTLALSYEVKQMMGEAGIEGGAQDLEWRVAALAGVWVVGAAVFGLLIQWAKPRRKKSGLDVYITETGRDDRIEPTF